MNQSQSWQETWHCPCAWNQSEKDSTRGRTLTLERRVFATVATADQIAVDSGGEQWREVAGGKKTIRRPEAVEQDTRGLRGFKGIFKISPVSIYIPTLSV